MAVAVVSRSSGVAPDSADMLFCQEVIQLKRVYIDVRRDI